MLVQVEEERDRLAQMLKEAIPDIVERLDGQALAAESKSALPLWAKASAVLGYYPSSDMPEEAGTIQQIVSDHERIRARLESLRRQEYNLWACDRIEKAWADYFGDKDKEARKETCIYFLSPIEPNHLEPLTFDLYEAFIGTLRKRLDSDKEYRRLIRDISGSERILPGEEGEHG